MTINGNAWEHKERAELVVSGFFPPRRRTRQGPQCEAERTIRPLLCFYITRHWAHRGQDSNAEITVRCGTVTVIITQHHVELRHNVTYTSCWVTNQWTDEGQPASELRRQSRIAAWHTVHLVHTADTATQKVMQLAQVTLSDQ